MYQANLFANIAGDELPALLAECEALGANAELTGRMLAEGHEVLVTVPTLTVGRAVLQLWHGDSWDLDNEIATFRELSML